MRLAFLAVSALPFLVQSQAATLQERIQTRLAELQTETGFPGITAGVALADGTVLSAAAGFADQEKHVPLTPASRMFAGSTGKTFAAAVIVVREETSVERPKKAA